MTYPPSHSPAPFAPQPTPPKKHTALIVVLSIIGGLVLLCGGGGTLIALAGSDGADKPDTASAASGATHSTAAKPSPSKAATDALTLSCTGSGHVLLNYGTLAADHNTEADLPWSKTVRTTKSDDSFTLTATLSGNGKVTCAVSAGGKVLAKGSGNGGYASANVVLTRDFSGNWASV